MCGLFGVISTDEPAARRRAALGFDFLGIMAQERGTDASGMARFYGRPHPAPATTLTAAERLNPSIRVDGWHISRRPVKWKQFWKLPHLLKSERASILVGHTRRATRGESRNVANRSPMLVGNLIGTHNGGVAIQQLVERYGLGEMLGHTSSEAIFAALNTCGGNIDQIVRVLEGLRGRAALAWVDRNEPKRIYLARTALSPLATAWDEHGNFYWASSRQWFLTVDELSNYMCGFKNITQWQEGTLKVYQSRKTGAELQETRYFQSYVRESDVRVSERFLWDYRDAAWEKDNMRCWVKTQYGEIVKLNQPEPDYYDDDYWPGDLEEPEPEYYDDDYWPGSAATKKEYEQAKLGF